MLLSGRKLGGHQDEVAVSRAVSSGPHCFLGALVALGAVVLAGGCGSGALEGAQRTRSASRHRAPSVRLVRFDGMRGVFRVRNRSSGLLKRVAVGLRIFGCDGPRPTRTEVKVFDLHLRPGQGQSFSFQIEHRCRRAAVAVVAQ